VCFSTGTTRSYWWSWTIWLSGKNYIYWKFVFGLSHVQTTEEAMIHSTQDCKMYLLYCKNYLVETTKKWLSQLHFWSVHSVFSTDLIRSQKIVSLFFSYHDLCVIKIQLYWKSSPTFLLMFFVSFLGSPRCTRRTWCSWIWWNTGKISLDWFVDWWLVGWLWWLVEWLVGWLVWWLVGWLVWWLVGWLDGWLVGWLVVFLCMYCVVLFWP